MTHQSPSAAFPGGMLVCTEREDWKSLALCGSLGMDPDKVKNFIIKMINNQVHDKSIKLAVIIKLLG